MDTKVFAENIKAARQKAGLTLRDVQDRTDIAYTYVHKVESNYPGAVEGLKMGKALQLANLYGVTLDSLVGEADPCGIFARLSPQRKADLMKIAGMWVEGDSTEEELAGLLAVDGLFHRGAIGGLLPALLGLDAKDTDTVQAALNGGKMGR